MDNVDDETIGGKPEERVKNPVFYFNDKDVKDFVHRMETLIACEACVHAGPYSCDLGMTKYPFKSTISSGSCRKFIDLRQKGE